MRSKTILFSIFLVITLGRAASASERECQSTGVVVTCGDASIRVRCDGYRAVTHVANDQKLTQISFDLATQDMTSDDEREKNFVSLKEPKAKFYDYSVVTNLYGQAMVDGTFDLREATTKNPELKVALLEINDLVRAKREAGFKRKPGASLGPVIGSFKIPSDAALYLKCEKEKGVAVLDVTPASAPASGAPTSR